MLDPDDLVLHGNILFSYLSVFKEYSDFKDYFNLININILFQLTIAEACVLKRKTSFY